MWLRDPELDTLWGSLETARARHRDELIGRTDAMLVFSTRYDALLALEAYASALQRRQLPVPPTVRRDLTLQRNLCRSWERWRGAERPA